MSLVKKLKDILFEEEEYVEPKKEEVKVIKEEREEVKTEEVAEKKEVVSNINNTNNFNNNPEPFMEKEYSERETFKKDNGFRFPDFDEDEFASSIRKKPANNVVEYERKKTYEKRTDYGRYERVETKEYTEKKKFKPSLIISPVYGVLNQDYKAEDIVNKKEVSSNIDIDSVRKKAFEPQPVEKIESIDDPVVTFFEEKETVKYKEVPRRETYKSINELLEEAAEEISLEDTLELPRTNNLDAIEEELEKLEIEPKKEYKNLEDTLDNDLFELIDSMYDDREED